MLYSVINNGVNQRDIVYFVTDTLRIHQSGFPYLFTDGHAIMFLTEFYSRLDDLDNIDWSVMKELYWADTKEDPDKKWRRQAEFLVHQQVPMDLFTGLAVIDEETKEKVDALLQYHRIDKPVGIRKNFYY